MQDKEQAIIAASSLSTKITGTATVATAGTAGFWDVIMHHQQPILIGCAVIGAIVTIITATINSRFQKKRDEREEEHNLREREAEERRKLAHEKEMAIKDFRLEELKKNKDNRRKDD